MHNDLIAAKNKLHIQVWSADVWSVPNNQHGFAVNSWSAFVE